MITVRAAITSELVRRLVDTQFPRWASLPLRLVEPAGSDHVIHPTLNRVPNDAPPLSRAYHVRPARTDSGRSVSASASGEHLSVIDDAQVT